MSTTEGVEAIRRKLLRDAEEEARRIVLEAEKRASEIVEEAKRGVEIKIESEYKSRADSFEQTKRERIAEERLEYNRRLQTYRSELLDSVFDEALKRLHSYCESDRYLETLKGFIVEAGVALGGGNLVVALNERDLKLVDERHLMEISKEIEKRADTKTSLKLSDTLIKSIGGAIISKADGSVTINNTMEERLKRFRERSRSEVETILFR